MTSSEHQHSSAPLTWMVRTTDNVISGPYTQKQIIQLLEDGKLELTDEICHSNHYWIALHEQEEVKKQLGIGLPRSIFELEDSTQTETDSEIAHAASGPRVVKNASQLASQGSTPAASEGSSQGSSMMSSQAASDDGIPELPADADEEYTAVLSNRAFREFRPREIASPSVAQPKAVEPSIQEVPGIEMPELAEAKATVSSSASSQTSPRSGHLPDLQLPDEGFRVWIVTVIALCATAVYFLFKIFLEMRR